jgi:excisionase family DNA binding protein
MRPYEVAVLIGCAGNTVRRWADEGFLPSTRTEAGQRRYPRREIEAMAQAGELPQPWRAGGWDDHPEGPVTRQPPRFRRWEQADLLDEITGP